jgi:DUF4097 and DUF4098 domain-containing protein YvlB
MRESGQISKQIVLQEVFSMKRMIIAAMLVLALVALCAGSVVAILPFAAELRAGRVQFGLFSLSRVGADQTEERRLAVSEPVRLTVDTPRGSVDVRGVPGTGEVAVSMHKYAWGANSEAANRLLEQLTVKITQTGGEIRITVEQPVEVDILHIGPADTQVDFTITVPADCAVAASSSLGEITVADTTGDAALKTDFGEIHARNIDGGLTAHSNSGKVVISDAGSADAALNASSDFGEVYLENIAAASVTGKSNAGDVTLRNAQVEDLVDLSTDFGVLRMEDVGASRANLNSNSGQVNLTRVTAAGRLSAETDFGDIICSACSASEYALRTSAGRVEADGLQGSVVARSSMGDVRLTGTAVVIDASTNSGTVVFSGTLGEGTSVLQSNLGDVDISLPEDSQFHLDLKTDLGSVHSDFPVTAASAGSTHLSGDVGEGGPTLKASTNSGSVAVRILSDAANPAANK